MMYDSSYNLPDNVSEIVEELKKHGSAEYNFYDYEPSMEMTNGEAMGYFLDHIELNEDLVEENLDTLVIFKIDGEDRNIAIDSFGGGDFFSHCFTCSWVEE